MTLLICEKAVKMLSHYTCTAPHRSNLNYKYSLNPCSSAFHSQLLLRNDPFPCYNLSTCYHWKLFWTQRCVWLFILTIDYFTNQLKPVRVLTPCVNASLKNAKC